jgi:SNF2 family DNA or RNA helicase
MGLGKTAIVLRYLQMTRKQALVVAPLMAALHTWPTEIKKWTPTLSYGVAHGAAKDWVISQGLDIKVINYDGLVWLHKFLSNKPGSLSAIRDRVLVLDESTCIKNHKTHRFKALKAMLGMFPKVINLSGEPLPNGYPGLWSQYYCLDKGQRLEPTFTKFKMTYFHDLGAPSFKLIPRSPAIYSEIQDKVSDITTVLRAKDYLDLPKVMYHNLVCRLSETEKKLYDSILTKPLNPDQPLSAGLRINQMRQATGGRVYMSHQQEDNETPGARTTHIHDQKMTQMVTMAETITESMIVAINFRYEAEWLQTTLAARLGVANVGCIIGDTPVRERNSTINRWNDQKLQILICHPQVLGHGLNLQFGGHVLVWYSLPWSLEFYKQLNGRLHRQGQTKPVRIYHLIAKDTVDEYVAEVLSNKNATQEDFKTAVMNGVNPQGSWLFG